MKLSGPGTYYFQVHGAKGQPIFHSVFEYDFFCQLLANTSDVQLIAYVLSEHQAQWIMKCERDWQDVLDDIKAAAQESYFQIWHKHHQVLSEEADVIFIDEESYLVPMVIAMHNWPVANKLVASPESYSWSSDHHYRQPHSPDWLFAGHMRNRLAHQRFNTALRYERIMENPPEFSAQDHMHRLYDALADDQRISLHLQRHRQSEPLAAEACMAMRAQAEHLVNTVLGIKATAEEGLETPRLRRQYHQTEPLSMWLLSESGWSAKQLAWVFDVDEVVLLGWLRSIETIHPSSFLELMKNRWREELHISNGQNTLPQIEDVAV